MSSYKRKIWFIVPFYITIIAAGLPLDESQLYSWTSFEADSSKSSGPNGRTVGNLTDVVYKAALRLLRCTAVPDNPHDIALLDPLVFSFDQLAHRKTIRLDGTINGTESELSQLNINYVTVALLSSSAKFKGLLPRLSITGTYNITGTLANTLPFFGSGPYSVEMRNVSMLVTAALGSYKNGSLYMSNFIVDFTPESVQVSLGELLGGGPLGELVQDFLQDASPQIVAHSKPLIQEDLKETVITAANRRLVTVAGLSGLVAFLTSFGNVTQSC